MGGPENGNFPLLYVVKCPYLGGWVVQKSLKTPLRNIKMAPKYTTKCNLTYNAHFQLKIQSVPALILT